MKINIKIVIKINGIKNINLFYKHYYKNRNIIFKLFYHNLIK